MSNNVRPPYAGENKKLIISIDVGTTFTAASFCLLQPGNVPKFEEILRWPKQATPDAKVPSVVYYDSRGNAMAFGAETEDEDTVIEAEENNWKRADWWKLHLRPSHLPIIRDLQVPPLPPNVTLDKVFIDFLRYIKEQIKKYITETYGSGGNLWDVLSPTMYVILTTPNGWEGAQQNRMRTAAIAAGLVDRDGGRRVRFVTEAEAAILYAVDSGNVEDWLVEDGHLILCDCGGGTVDITGYKINAVKPTLKLEESAASRCYLAGAVFVTQAAQKFFKERLHGTEWADEERMQRIVYHFDRNAKKKFSETDTACYVQLDGHRSIPEKNITRGRLKITKEEMISFFKGPVDEIKHGLEVAFENGGRLADKVILVGGLASSPYVFSKLVQWGEENGISVSRPDGPTVKAVANGALAWHIDSSVGSRIARYHYGIPASIPYLQDNADHSTRAAQKYLDYDNMERISGAWSGIVKRNEKIEATKEFSEDFSVTWEATRTAYTHSTNIYAYRRATPPTFMKFPGRQTLLPGFDHLCTVSGDLTQCFRATRAQNTAQGVRVKKLFFDVCLTLGDTEISARMRWKVGADYAYGPATVAYD